MGQDSRPDFEWIGGVVALLTMVVASVWGENALRHAGGNGRPHGGMHDRFSRLPRYWHQAVALPAQAIVIPRWPLFEISFTTSYLPGFMIGAVSSFLRVTGDVIASHQVSDHNWKRPDTRSVAAGGLAEGLGNMIAGLIGSMPINTHSGSVGLVAASGMSSRFIAIGVGVMWLVMAVLPFGVSLLLLVPATVQGAAVFFTGGFVMRAGFNMLTQRLIDNRRAITIGSALIVGISFDEVLHGLQLSPHIKMAFSSPLLASVTTAILLTALFRVGVKRSVSLSWDPASGERPLRDWIAASGRLWAARTQLIDRAEAVLEEFAEAAPYFTQAPVRIAAHYDEISLKLDMTWTGAAAMDPSRGSLNLDTDDKVLAVKLAMTLMRRIADHMSETILPDGARRLAVTLDDL